MTNPTKKERWWDEDKDFETWFREEYGTEFQAVGVISSALCHEKMMPFGSDASYMTKNLERIFKERDSQTIRDIMEVVKKMRQKHEVETDPSGAFSICLICDENGATKGEFCESAENQLLSDLLSHLEGLLYKKNER